MQENDQYVPQFRDFHKSSLGSRILRSQFFLGLIYPTNGRMDTRQQSTQIMAFLTPGITAAKADHY